jgi:hypothetical protein
MHDSRDRRRQHRRSNPTFEAFGKAAFRSRRAAADERFDDVGICKAARQVFANLGPHDIAFQGCTRHNVVEPPRSPSGANPVSPPSRTRRSARARCRRTCACNIESSAEADSPSARSADRPSSRSVIARRNGTSRPLNDAAFVGREPETTTNSGDRRALTIVPTAMHQASDSPYNHAHRRHRTLPYRAR